jgi:hypothetical protein
VKLQINGKTVQVDDSFASASPEDQDATVNEIADSLGSNPPTPTRKDTILNRLKKPETKAARFVEAVDPYVTPVLQTAYKIGQGGTFGFSDEIAKALGTNADSMDASKAQVEKDLGGFGTAMEIGGAIPAAIASTPVGLISKGAQLAGKFAPAAKVLGGATANAIQAGTYGFGTGEGDAASRLKSAEKPAMAAGALSILLPPAASLAVNTGSKLTGIVKNRLASPDVRAQKAASEIAQSAGINPQEAARKLSEYGAEAIPADVNEALRKQGAVSLSKSGTEQQAAMDFLDARQAKQHGDLLATVAKGFNTGGDNIYDALAKNKAARSAAAPELYKKAFDQPLPEKFMNDARIKNPAIQDLLEKGKIEAMDDPNRIDAVTGIVKPPTPVETWHYAKQYLNNEIGKAARAGADNDVRKLSAKRDIINGVLRDIPDYVKANDLWADSKSLENAAEVGKGFLKQNPREFSDTYSKLGDSEKLIAKMSAIDDLGFKFGKTGDNRSVYQELVGNEVARQNLKTVLGQSGLDDLMKTAKKWEAFSRTRSMVQQQSKTQPFLSTERAMEDIAGASKKGMTDKLLEKIIVGDTAPYNNALAQKLMTPQTESDVVNFLSSKPTKQVNYMGRGIGTTIGALDKK